MAVYYECPNCKAHNAEHQKYCVDCGTWLLSTTFPAKRVDTAKKKRKTGGSIIALIVIGLVIYLAWSNPDSIPAFNSNIRFEPINIGDSYMITQLVVDPSGPSATADFTAISEMRDPVEISIAYYDEKDRRIGLSTAIITNTLAAGQTTTVAFRFKEANGLSSTRQIRVELTPLSPLMLLERAADLVQQP